MVLLIAGGTHTGKTLLAQRLVARYHWFALSVDHLKMGLIRAGLCPLTPQSSDADLTEFLWPVVREMVKTAVENGQDLIVEGCYIPFSWREDFDGRYLPHLRFVCLAFSDAYLRDHFADVLAHANDAEQRLDDASCTRQALLAENRANRAACCRWGCEMLLIDGTYAVDWAPCPPPQG